jgi:hypothetical protein
MLVTGRGCLLPSAGLFLAWRQALGRIEVPELDINVVQPLDITLWTMGNLGFGPESKLWLFLSWFPGISQTLITGRLLEH